MLKYYWNNTSIFYFSKHTYNLRHDLTDRLLSAQLLGKSKPLKDRVCTAAQHRKL